MRPLHPGAVFAEAAEPERVGGLSELLMVDTGDEALAGLDEETADYTAKELEAEIDRCKDQEMTDPEHGFLVWDKKSRGGRRLSNGPVSRYGDSPAQYCGLDGDALQILF